MTTRKAQTRSRSNIPQFLETGLGQGPLEAALRLSPWTGTLFVVAPIAGALVDRVGERPQSAPALETA